MNFRLRANLSVILMSLRRGAPYADRIEDDGKTLIYEGHENGGTGPPFLLLSVCNFLNQNLALSPDAAAF